MAETCSDYTTGLEIKRVINKPEFMSLTCMCCYFRKVSLSVALLRTEYQRCERSKICAFLADSPVNSLKKPLNGAARLELFKIYML